MVTVCRATRAPDPNHSPRPEESATVTFSETLHSDWTQTFEVEEVLFDSRTEHQHLVFFRNRTYGRVMALDGVIQTTERDEFIYHEMLAHVPILAHGGARRVLVVGGGDGAMLREVVKHARVEVITLVEIDRAIIDLSRQYLPNHSQGAFDNPRVRLLIDDGALFVDNTDERYDVIISDSTDPIGPGEALFTTEFYAGCKRCLAEGGVLVAQNGCAFGQLDEIVTTHRRMAPLFQDHVFYCAAIPTYIGGAMYFAWATDAQDLRSVSLPELESRYAASGIDTRYYTPAIHRGAFALPKFILEELKEN